MRAHFFLTILVSAFLLLLVQPMLAKMLLPYVGGAPAVWIASVLFFQAMLLAGYGYAAITSNLLSPRHQWMLHLLIFASTVAIVIPLSLHLPELSATRHPTRWVLLSLLLTIGLPYFILSASSSLLQHWYHSCTGKEPYFLFSASNAGSFLGLFAYPLLIEWLFALPEQLTFFSNGFILLFILFSGFLLWLKHSQNVSPAPQLSSLDRKTTGKAIFLAFLPSALFLALTLHVTTDIGSFPFIWIIPLALYLLSFVIAFATWGERWIKLAQKMHLAAIVIFLFSLFLFHHPAIMIVHFTLFFIVAISCHGQLARIRPTPEKLTAFFFWVSFGGVLGGLFNVLAPTLLNGAYEYPVLMALSPLILPAKRKLSDLLKLSKQEKQRIAGMIVLLILITSTLWVDIVPSSNPEVSLHKSRNFYGVSKVAELTTPEGTKFHKYTHGTTLHGIQALDEEQRLIPRSYYTPVFKLLKTFPDHYYTQPFGIIGLGAGTGACFGRTGQQIDFYEIDEDVIKIAKDPKLFTYLRDCPPETRLIQGDGRITLKEQPDGINYNMLMIDAFTSDAIPMHLLTKEAFALYLTKVHPQTGILTLNISNRYYNLTPFLARIADEFGWITYKMRSKTDFKSMEFASQWLVMLPADSPWKTQLEEAELQHIQPEDDIPLWTDNYSHILPAIIVGD